MDLLEGGRRLQFFRRIAENFLVREAIKEPPPVHVHHSDHICGVFANQVKKLFALDKLPADAVNQQVLIDGVKVEEEHESHQASDGLRH